MAINANKIGAGAGVAVLLLLLGFLLFTPLSIIARSENAMDKCGEGNVKSVSMEGFKCKKALPD